MSIKHPVSYVDGNAVAARNIARSIIGKGCNYADGRKNGVRYKWLFNRMDMVPTHVYIDQIENALYLAGIKNFHIGSHNKGLAISLTMYAVS